MRSGDDYYWLYLKTVIEDSSNKDNVGISKLEFYTAFEALKDTGIEDGGNINDNSVGLFVYDENNADKKIGCVNGLACEFPNEIGSLDLGEVKNFLKNDKSFEKFKEKFGKPDITQDDGYINYYGLSAANGKKYYLSISSDNGLIYYAEVVDDFKCVEVVYSESDL